jgi:hypothetical protein
MWEDDTSEGREALEVMLRDEDIVDNGGGVSRSGDSQRGFVEGRMHVQGGQPGSAGGKRPFKMVNWVWSVRSLVVTSALTSADVNLTSGSRSPDETDGAEGSVTHSIFVRFTKKPPKNGQHKKENG